MKIILKIIIILDEMDQDFLMKMVDEMDQDGIGDQYLTGKPTEPGPDERAERLSREVQRHRTLTMNGCGLSWKSSDKCPEKYSDQDWSWSVSLGNPMLTSVARNDAKTTHSDQDLSLSAWPGNPLTSVVSYCRNTLQSR